MSVHKPYCWFPRSGDQLRFCCGNHLLQRSRLVHIWPTWWKWQLKNNHQLTLQAQAEPKNFEDLELSNRDSIEICCGQHYAAASLVHEWPPLIHHSGRQGARPFPADLGWRWGYTLDKSPVYGRATIQSCQWVQCGGRKWESLVAWARPNISSLCGARSFKRWHARGQTVWMKAKHWLHRKMDRVCSIKKEVNVECNNNLHCVVWSAGTTKGGYKRLKVAGFHYRREL